MYGQSYYNPSVINRVEENKAKKAGVALKTTIFSGGRIYPIYKEGDNAVVYIGNVKHILPNSKKIIKENKSMSIFFQDAMNKKSSKQEETKTEASGAPGGSGTGTGLSTAIQKDELIAAKPEAPERWQFNKDDYANQYGLVLDYADILKDREEATNLMFDELDTQFNRTERAMLRSQDAAYDNYLNNLRTQAANAVSTGAMRGASQANALAEALAMQQINKEVGTDFSDMAFNLAQQRGTALAKDRVEAETEAYNRANALANLDLGFFGQDIQKYVGDLAYAGQLNQAQVNAIGTILSSKIGAGATRYQADTQAQATRDAAVANNQWFHDMYGEAAPRVHSGSLGLTQKDYDKYIAPNIGPGNYPYRR